jgi:hypothetical protein
LMVILVAVMYEVYHVEYVLYKSTAEVTADKRICVEKCLKFEIRKSSGTFTARVAGTHLSLAHRHCLE